LAKHLAAENQVIAAARFTEPEDYRELELAGAEIVQLDLADPDLTRLPAQCDVVMHFGATTAFPTSPKDRRELLNVNVDATGRLAERYADCDAFVYASSGSTYLYAGERPVKEEDSYGLHSGLETYAASKIAAERLLHYLSGKSGLNVAILRIFAAYGPRGGACIARAIKARAGEAIALYPGVKNYSCLIFETDYVDKAIKAASIASNPPETVNLAGSDVSSLEEYCRFACELIGRTARFKESADALYPIRPDTSKMEQLLGPTTITVQEGFTRVLSSEGSGRTSKWAAWAEPSGSSDAGLQ
jgi:nucleoside-diphosphate-sugar epimerase